ncbi:hypothetical protein ABZ901_34515, partial [Actinacidiphila alni]
MRVARARTRTAAAVAVAATASALLTLGAAGTASADDVPVGDYGKYVTIDGPKGLEVGGGWGVWTVDAKNPNAVADTTDHLAFNAEGPTGANQLEFQIRAGTTRAWKDAPTKWANIGTAAHPHYLASFDFTGAALGLAPHSDTTFQVRARQIPTKDATDPFAVGFSAVLTPQLGADGQPGDFLARAYVPVAPQGLTTTFKGLPTTVPADGRTRQFQVRISTANKADWHLGKASFFLWQGEKNGTKGTPSACDAEVDVLDSATHTWHKVGLIPAGIDERSVDLSWATGPAYDRTLTARITLGAGYRTDKNPSIGFGYYPGSGEPDYFWASQKLAATPVAGAPTCVKPGSVTDTPTSTPSAAPTANSTGDANAPAPAGSDGPALAATGGGGSTGLLTGVAAALVA